MKGVSFSRLQLISSSFLQELKQAYEGKKTSLRFIIHELSPAPLVKEGENFEVLAVGGSIYKIATLKKNGENIQILDKREEQLSFKTEKEFLDFINSRLPNNINVIALNFAYPIKPVFANGKLDGILLTVIKEGGFHGLVGKQIGKEIENYVLAKRNKKIKVAVANDTVCLLTSGLAQFQKKELAAGVVGTGLNFAFFLDKNRLVNLESANFDKFSQSNEGKVIDRQSQQPKDHIFEKETAGAYLYKHFNLIIKERGLNFSHILSTRQLNEISLKNISEVSIIAQDLLIRSAKLVACQIAGIVNFKKTNMTFVMEGSLFWKGNNYKETVEKTVMQLVPEYKIDFVEIENSAILGAAKLVS